MLKKVALNKRQIDNLIKLKKYTEALDYINNVRVVINLVAKTRVNQFIKVKIILEKEKNVFISLIENNINNKLLEDNQYMLIDESYVNLMKEKTLKMKSLIEKKKFIKA